MSNAVADSNLRCDFDKHADVIGGQGSADVHGILFSANIPDNFTDAHPDPTMQDPESEFGCPGNITAAMLYQRLTQTQSESPFGKRETVQMLTIQTGSGAKSLGPFFLALPSSLPIVDSTYREGMVTCIGTCYYNKNGRCLGFEPTTL